MTAREPHLCHAEGCTAPCPPRMLMCPAHWQMVPSGQQRAVLDAYQPGQERLRVMPSEAWFGAGFRAINSVAVKEGRPVPYPGVEEPIETPGAGR